MFAPTTFRIFMSVLLCLLLAGGVPSIVQAGAWPRQQGTWFLSVYSTHDRANWLRLPDAGAYLEYGLAERWTVGGQIEYSLHREQVTDGKVFARLHFPNGDVWQKAIGATVTGIGQDALRFAPSFHLGRGIVTPFGDGWFDMSVRAELPFDGSAMAVATFAQLGVKPHERVMAMVSLDVFADEGATTVKFIPSLAWQVRPGRHLQIEWRETVEPVAVSKLGVGLWMEF